MESKTLESKLDQMGLLVDQVNAWAETMPDRPFFYYGEEDRLLTYGEFNGLANAMANNFRSMGVGRGDRVSLFLKNPLVTTLSMYGLWKVGAVFCPINFLYQGRLLSYQINDTRPELLITESGREPILNQIKSDIEGLPVVIHHPKKDEHDYREDEANLKLDASFNQTLFEELLSGDRTSPDVKMNYWETANIVYTSGTTGPPKGVVQSYRWLQNYCYYGTKMLHPDDVVYCDLPLYHIGGAFALVGRAAWRGASVAVWDRFSPSDFWNRIKVSGGSYCLLLDVMMPRLLQPDPKQDDRDNTLNRVHMQPLPEYHHRFSKRFGIDFVNVGYGATEIGYACAAIIDESGDEKWTPEAFRKGYTKQEVVDVAAELGLPVVPGDREIKKGFMGKSCMFHELAILGEHDEKLGAGEYGQIAMRNRLPSVLLDEYFNRSEATAEVFRNLWFHTGDGAYRDEDGMFYFVDRMGGFIRVKGENISSFQVEDVINAHPYVSVSAAFPVPAAEGLEDDIVVYVVPVSGKGLTEEALANWIKTEMPRYMQPKHIRFVDALPETPTHKVEKYKLKEMFLSGS